ncbi:MAG TPA: sigma-E factor negative regulatory protein [Steroidobacteraceae bacterium]|nr:sigma-E factor negative regulatory protein [Steroidobacteraceae bacterium]
MKEELDSQLSAMFDDELPPAECELLARRLSRDEQLKARWGRYAMIGATIRAEGSARLNANLARRVSSAISAEPALLSAPARQKTAALAGRWWRPFAGAAVAASVAAASILWMRYEAVGVPEVAQSLPMTAGPAASDTLASRQVLVSSNTARAASAPDSYVVPRAHPRRSIVPSAELANYVVAHSEFSSPVTRRNLLSTLMSSESGAAVATSASEDPTEDVYDDAKSAQ